MKILLILLALLPSIAFANMPTVILDGSIIITPPILNTDGSPVGPLTYSLYCNSGSAEYIETDLVLTTPDNIIPIASLSLNGNQMCSTTTTSDIGTSVFSNQINFMCTGQCLSGLGPLPSVIRVE